MSHGKRMRTGVPQGNPVVRVKPTRLFSDINDFSDHINIKQLTKKVTVKKRAVHSVIMRYYPVGSSGK